MHHPKLRRKAAGPPLPVVPAQIPPLAEPRGKRVCDLILAGLGLVLSLPLWLLIPLAIKRDDGGPVFHREARWGRGGQAFPIVKFRTFALSPSQPGAAASPTGERYFSRVGRFLRARGLDEVPQLLNVWRGEMSLVGPRPLAVEEIPVHLQPELLARPELSGFRERLRVRPGLTGIAQIYGTKYLSHRQKFRYDRLYVDHPGVWLDLRLFAFSLWLSARARWETTEKKF